MKKMFAAAISGLLATVATAEVSPEELVNAIDKLSPEQAYEIRQKMEAKLWEPLPEKIWSNMGISLAARSIEIDDLDLSGVGLASSDLDLDEASGAAIGIYWPVGCEHFHLGVKFGGWEVSDNDLAAAGYSRVQVESGELGLAAHVHLVKKESFSLWVEGTPSYAYTSVQTVNSPTGGASTIREFDKEYGQVDVELGFSWRFNPLMALYVSGGYRFAESVTLEEGGEDGGVTLDASGGVGSVGFSLNL